MASGELYLKDIIKDKKTSIYEKVAAIFTLGCENNPSISFEVAGSQTKMTHSLGTRGAWVANGMSPRNYGGLIGVTDDGVEGVDLFKD
jgi:hypothetical protein